MRGLKAKQLRNIANRIAERQALPDLLYLTTPVQKFMLIGGNRITITIGVKTLGECKRKVYKDLKRFYKLGMEGLYD